jgi:hypothetical protein
MSNHESCAHLTFFPADAVVGFLQSDPDHYYDTFTRFDLRARHVASVADYINRIPNAIVDASAGLRARIREAVPIIDARLRGIRHVGFNGKKAADLPWRIGFMKENKKDKLYEDGLPHTRVDLIMLPIRLAKASDRELVDTLFHEKVHIYQKAYPRDLERWLAHNGFERVRRRTKGSRIRANPDIDGWVYRDTNRVYKCLYSSETPRHIEDVKEGGLDFEHPFEAAAAALSSPLEKGRTPK